MKKLLLSVFVMCAMCETSWSKIERICVAPAGCPIVMETGECPNCIDKYAEEEENEYTDEYLNGLLAKSKELRIKGKWKCIVGPCDWIDSNGNLIVKK
jgi:hypothetical protein